MGKEEVIKEFLLLLKENIRNVQIIVATAELLLITNEQFYIDYEIELSQLATKDHNKPL